jgi:peroxiredoxin
MKYFIVVSFVLLSFSFSIAQEILIKAANSTGKAALFSLSGENSLFIDSVTVNINETYQFSLNNSHPGFYRLVISNKKWIDFVFNNEDVMIETDLENILDRTGTIQSEENKIYYDFIRLNNDYKTKTELLQLIIARYPETDNYYQSTKEKLNQTREDYLYFVNVTAQSSPKSFIARYVRSAQLPVVNSEILPEQYLNYLKSHALDNVNFSDDALIYSDAFTNKAIEYLTYYRNPQLPMALLEKEFETAVDSILNKAKVNDIVYKHIVEYLLDGFKKFGFDNVINYIVENYVIKDNICLDETLETALDRRISQSKYLKSGDSVPNIILPDASGALIELNKINAEKILIIFYASLCPHCKTLLPQICQLYKNQKDKQFEVIAVSIDTSKTDWLNFTITHKLDWLNVSDLKGWDSKAAKDYYIYATPTMFLIDKEKKLIKTITEIEELKNYLQ